MGTLNKRQLEMRKNLMKIRPGATPAEVRSRIAEMCAENNYDPVQELLLFVQTSGEVLAHEIREIASVVRNKVISKKLENVANTIKHVGVGGDSRDIIGIHKELLQYIAPKLRSMEVKGELDVNFNITVTKYAEEVSS